jgi:hypothetical protein
VALPLRFDDMVSVYSDNACLTVLLLLWQHLRYPPI